MQLPQQVADVLLNADGKALASFSEGDINVVPVSSVRVVNGKIWLINCFMGKTVQNIMREPRVSLACWKGGIGYQIKASADYHSDGDQFEAAKQWIKEILPERTVKGLIILEPAAVFDVSPSKERAGAQVC